MKKVSLITLQAVKNYGSVLQALATQEFLRKHNLDVEVVDYIRPDVSDSKLMSTWLENDKGIKAYFKKKILTPTIRRWSLVFNTFLKENLNMSKKTYTYYEDFIKSPIEADIYCVGSDQVWNSTWNRGFVPELFLAYAPDSKKKIAFASSFGKNELDNDEKEKTAKLLKRFDAISVREKSGLDILSDLGIGQAIQILDPTLLFDKKFWEKFAADRMIKENYLLVYQLNSNKRFDDFAKNYAKDNNLKLVRLCTRYDQILKNGKAIIIPEVNEFVSLFNNASCIITDSFHATAFSINLNKPFISIYPGEFSTRLESILILMNLKNRHLENFDQHIIMEDINFSQANEVLHNQRMLADEFVKNSFK